MSAMSKTKPQRRCVGCGKSFDQDSLFRIKLSKNRELLPDADGSVPGRSAYICRNLSCVEMAKKKKALERSFKGSIDKSVYDTLIVTV